MVFGGSIIFFLIVRAARARPSVADRQGKAEAVAVSALMLQCIKASCGMMGSGGRGVQARRA